MVILNCIIKTKHNLEKGSIYTYALKFKHYKNMCNYEMKLKQTKQGFVQQLSAFFILIKVENKTLLIPTYIHT